MGFVVSKVFWFWTPAGYDVPDPATGITPRQKDIVQSTWKIVRADMRKNGILLFMKFFGMFPEYQSIFPGFANVPRDQLPENGKLLGHAMAVMYALSSVIDNLNDTECLLEILRKVGVSHRPKNLTANHFKNLTTVVISYLKEALGPSVFDKTAEEAWQKSLDVANSVIVKSLEGKEQS